MADVRSSPAHDDARMLRAQQGYVSSLMRERARRRRDGSGNDGGGGRGGPNGGAFLFANAAALVTDAFPREQLGLAMGTNTMVAAVGLVLGPVLGGALVAISWHWVFWFNVPFTAVGSIWAALILRELAKPDSVRGLDLLGTTTFVAGLTGLVLGLSRGGITGWGDPVTIVSLVVGVLLL